jgi:hypothetical protein
MRGCAYVHNNYCQEVIQQTWHHDVDWEVQTWHLQKEYKILRSVFSVCTENWKEMQISKLNIWEINMLDKPNKVDAALSHCW